MAKPKPDNRSDNVRRLREMTVNTIENLEEARETLNNTSLSDEQRSAIEAKNERREASIRSFRNEIKDEFHDQVEE